MPRFLLALALLAAFALPSGAQTQTVAPERLRAAAELVDAMNVQQMMNETADATIRAQVKQTPMLAQFEDILRETMSRALRWEDIRSDYVRMYAEVYTADELRQLRTFYQTPLGQRLLATMPQVALKSMEISNRRMEQFLPEMQQRIMQRMMAAPDTTRKP